MSEIPKVSVFNLVSKAADILKFSTESAINNAGMEFDYVVIVWEPSSGVMDYLRGIKCHIFPYYTDEKISFMANLRSMFNHGFRRGLAINDYVVPINTDNLFYKDWLINLAKYARSERVICSKLIEPGIVPTIHTMRNFGQPTQEEFQLEEFNKFCSQIYIDKYITQAEYIRRVDATPYILHKNCWEKCGPWELEPIRGEPPDVRFFNRFHHNGFEVGKSLGSISYHWGGLEVKRRRGFYG